MAINERVYTISGDLINEIISSNTIRDQDVQDRVITKLETLVRKEDTALILEEDELVDRGPLTPEELTEGEELEKIIAKDPVGRKKSGF